MVLERRRKETRSLVVPLLVTLILSSNSARLRALILLARRIAR
jgi:hypothetical protein